MLIIKYIFAIAVCLLFLPIIAKGSSEQVSFIEKPPLFINSFPDFPLAGFGVEMPDPGAILPAVDVASWSSNGFKENDIYVQPDLTLNATTYRFGGLRGFNGDWAAGLSIPWVRSRANATIGGQQASGVGEGIGNILLAGKKTVWQKCAKNERIVLTGGIDLPTGNDDNTFAGSNIVTNGYYRNFPQRMPLGWQASTGTVNGYLGLAYGKSQCRFAYEALVAGKFFTPGDEDVKIGNIFVASASGTYGISKRFAATLELALRSQADDSYPNSPIPVNSPLLAGTTSHGTTFYVNPSFRFNISKVNIGFGIIYPVVKPDDGMVPRTSVFVIFYPSGF